MRRWQVLAAALSIACRPAARGPEGVPLPPPAASATLMDSTGARVGVATFSVVDSGVRLGVSVSGLTPGPHGIHIHEQGACTGPDFGSAGGHLNPAGKQHGADNPAGMHMGDMPNLEIAAGGTASTVIPLAPGLDPETLFDADGTAIVVHAGPDDYRTDPSGNSGARLACGVLSRP